MHNQATKIFLNFFLRPCLKNTVSWARFTCPLPYTLYSREQRKGGGRMSYAERREAILEVLCIRRHDTYRNLAFEFQVSRETIRQDIAVLMCSYPIETVRGRHGGGVKIADGFYLYRKKLTARQAALLVKLSAQLAGDDLATIDSILRQFAP